MTYQELTRQFAENAARSGVKPIHINYRPPEIKAAYNHFTGKGQSPTSRVQSQSSSPFAQHLRDQVRPETGVDEGDPNVKEQPIGGEGRSIANAQLEGQGFLYDPSVQSWVPQTPVNPSQQLGPPTPAGFPQQYAAQMAQAQNAVHGPVQSGLVGGGGAAQPVNPMLQQMQSGAGATTQPANPAAQNSQPFNMEIDRGTPGTGMMTQNYQIGANGIPQPTAAPGSGKGGGFRSAMKAAGLNDENLGLLDSLARSGQLPPQAVMNHGIELLKLQKSQEAGASKHTGDDEGERQFQEYFKTNGIDLNTGQPRDPKDVAAEFKKLRDAYTSVAAPQSTSALPSPPPGYTNVKSGSAGMATPETVAAVHQRMGPQATPDQVRQEMIAEGYQLK